MAKKVVEKLDNSELDNKKTNLKKEAENNVIPESKITNIKTFGSSEDCIVVEMVGTFRNMWNYLNKKMHIRRIREDTKDLEVIPIEFELGESREFELLQSQLIKIIIEGVEVEKTQENLLKFADKKGADFLEAMLGLLEENLEELGKLRAKTMGLNITNVF
ncbi:hypothetical protein [Sebaldella sp. S0638]|uniref:hypothetical protein n=1 Tax=Sebaldella sp. S0638 TaxID=2957809 RepID=UPI00209D1EC0|nr:hypothetical protein [Sebaldella sp. S0638]MCP1226666.1 hypothetical protein [Sebaldella sp. S0638]